MKSIAELKIGQSGTILSIEKSEISRVMLSLGLLPNKKVTLIRKAPFGNSFYLGLDSHSIALRKSEAQKIFVEIEG